jgi:hypothetical protein
MPSRFRFTYFGVIESLLVSQHTYSPPLFAPWPNTAHGAPQSQFGCETTQRATRLTCVSAVPFPSLARAFDDLRARVDPARVRDDQRLVLSLQERSPDLARPDDEVPQTVKLLDDDVHVSA